ncbi:M91 family zinc metallopeptidase [Streptomyces sp. HPF1205]|uniref:M91 family zinc metallopeptidase n=1 Tax=Streptomyces sp. HPF1205 TaxID=2873262 RepID=UPI001CEDF7CE|nr:toxin glutamine deamidase domain-containing protein [Streptomyces sp. HPF1205]
MAQFDTSQIRALGNAWLNDSHNLRGYLQTMHESVWSMSGAWTGKAGQAAQVVWNGSQTGEYNIWNEIFQAAWVAEQIGNSILDYADQVDKTVKEINKSHLIEALASIFGLILNGATLGLAGVIEELAAKVGTLASQLAADSAKFASIAAGLGEAAAFVTSAGIWGFLTLKNDIFSQILASETAHGPITIDWKGEVMNLGLGLEAGFGEHFGPKIARGDKNEKVPEVTHGGLGADVPNGVPHVDVPKFSETGPVKSAWSSTDTLVNPGTGKFTETGPATYGSDKFGASGNFVPDPAVKTDAAPGGKGDAGAPAPGDVRSAGGDPGGAAPLPGGARPAPERPAPTPGSAHGSTPDSPRPSDPAPGPGGPRSETGPQAAAGRGEMPATSGSADTAPASGTGPGKPRANLDPAPRGTRPYAHSASPAATAPPQRGDTAAGGADAHGSQPHDDVSLSPTGRPTGADAPVLASSAASHADSGTHTPATHDEGTGTARPADAGAGAPAGTSRGGQGGAGAGAVRAFHEGTGTGPVRAAGPDTGAVAGAVRAADAGAGSGAGFGGARGAGESAHGTGAVHETAGGAGASAPRPAGRFTGPEPAGGTRPGRGASPDGAGEVAAGGGAGRRPEPAPSAGASGAERPAAGGHGAPRDAARLETSASGTHEGAGRGKDVATSAFESSASAPHAAAGHDAGTPGRGHDHSMAGAAADSRPGTGAEPVRHDTASKSADAPDHGPGHHAEGSGPVGPEQKAAQWREFKDERSRHNALLLHAERHLETIHSQVDAAWARGADRFARTKQGKAHGDLGPSGDGSMDEYRERLFRENRWEQAVKDAQRNWRADFTRQFRAELETNGHISTEVHDRILHHADENAYRHLQRADQLLTFEDKFKEVLAAYKANRYGHGDDLPTFGKAPSGPGVDPKFHQAPSDYVYDKDLNTYVRDDSKVYGHRHEDGSTGLPADHPLNGKADEPVDFFRDKSHDYNALEKYYIDTREHLGDILDASLDDAGGVPRNMPARINKLLGDSATDFHIDRVLRDASHDLDWIARRERDVRAVTEDVTEDWFENLGWERSRSRDVVDHVRLDLARELRDLHDEVFIHQAGHDTVLAALHDKFSRRVVDAAVDAALHHEVHVPGPGEHTEFNSRDGQSARRQWVLRTKHLVAQFPERIAKAEFVHSQLAAEKEHVEFLLWEHHGEDSLGHLGEDGEQRLIGGYLKQVRTEAERHADAQQYAGLKAEGSSREWSGIRDRLRSTLPDRISHERDLQEVVSRSAETFGRLLGRPTDITDVPLHEDTISRLGDDFRTEHVTRFDKLFAPEGHRTDDWLAHESHHEDTFQNHLDELHRLDEASRKPGHLAEKPGTGPAASDGKDTPAGPAAPGDSADPAVPRREDPAAPERPGAPAEPHAPRREAPTATDGAHAAPPREHTAEQQQLTENAPAPTHQRPGRSPLRTAAGTAAETTAGTTADHALQGHEQEHAQAQATYGPSDLHREVHSRLPRGGYTFSHAQVHMAYEELLQQHPAVAGMSMQVKSFRVADALVASAKEVVAVATGPLQQLTGRYFDSGEIHQVHQRLVRQHGEEFLRLPPQRRAEHVVVEITDSRRLLQDAGRRPDQWDAAPAHVAHVRDQLVRTHGTAFPQWRPQTRADAAAETVERGRLLDGVRERLGRADVTADHVSYAYALVVREHGPEFTRLDIGHRAEFLAQVVRAQLDFTGDVHPAADARIHQEPRTAGAAHEPDAPRSATRGHDQSESSKPAKGKAVAVPPEPVRRPVDTESGFAGIVVRWDSETDPHFLATVQEQLRLLASKPAGKALLERIGAAATTSKLAAWQHAKVKIERIGGGTAVGRKQGPGYEAHAGNVTKAINSEWATMPGKGTLSLVRYNPNAWETPDGLRPPFIGLVHELIHAYRNLQGLSHRTAAVDEAQVVGFGEHADLEFTENRIRAEHGLPPRRTYAGTVGPDLDDAHLPRTTGRTGPRRAGRDIARGTGGRGAAGLFWNAGADRRELELSEKHGIRIGPSKRLSGGHFSHSVLDRIDAVLSDLPAEHIRDNPDLRYIEPDVGSGDGASSYHRETRGIGMVRPTAVPAWLYSRLDRGSGAQRFVMDRAALSGYDGVPVAEVLGIGGRRRNVMGGVSNVLAHGNLLEWTIRHEIGHSVTEHRAWFWAVQQQTAFGGWRVHAPVGGRVEDVADDVLRKAEIEDKADVLDEAGRTLFDVLAQELVPSRLREEPERLAGLAKTFPGADERLTGGLERVVDFVRLALAQPWTLDDGGAATLAIGLRVYHIDQEDRWVSYLWAERERHAVSNYQFSTPHEWFAEAYAAYYDPLPGPRERLNPVVREWFETGLPQLLAQERAPDADAVPTSPVTPAPPSAGPASAGVVGEPLLWAPMIVGQRLYSAPEGLSIRVRGPRKSGRDDRTPNRLTDAAWRKLPESTRQGLRKERLDVPVDPQTLAETDPALHKGLSNAGRSLEGGSISSTAARNAVLEALGRKDPLTRDYWKGQSERDEILGMVAREELRVFASRPHTRGTRDRLVERAVDGTSGVEALRTLLGEYEGVVIGEEHEGTAVRRLLADTMARLKAAGVRTVYLGGVRGDAYQPHLDRFLASGTMSPELHALARNYDEGAEPADKGLLDLLEAARRHDVRVVGVDGYPARETGGGGVAEVRFRRAAALNTYAAGLVRRDRRRLPDGTPGGYVVVVGAQHTGAHPGPEHQVVVHGQKFRPGEEFPGVDDLLDIPRVLQARDGSLHSRPRSSRSGTHPGVARGSHPDTGMAQQDMAPAAEVPDERVDSGRDPVDAAAPALELPEKYVWIKEVNRLRDQGGGFRTNCVLAAIATDMSLADPKRAVFQAPPSGPGEQGQGPADDGTGLTIYLGRYHGMEPYPVDGPAEVIEAMSQAPVGERGMVVLEGPGSPIAHVINVVRDDDGVVFLDGQAGTLAPPPAAAVSFLPTTGGIPGFPLDQAARAAAPAARSIPVGAIGTETELQFPLTLDRAGQERHGPLTYNRTLAYYTSLTPEQIDALDESRRIGIPQIKVDTTTVFQGVGGVAAMSEPQIRHMTGKPSIGRMDIKIPELVLPPMQTLREERNRYPSEHGMALHASVREGFSRTHSATRPMPLREVLGRGWVLTDTGKSVLVEKAPTGPQHPAYTQYTVGVPVTGLNAVLHLVEERLPAEFSDFAPILSAGRRFADSVTLSYAGDVLESVDPAQLPFLGSVAGLEELRGYAWLMFNHVAAVPVAVVYLDTISKAVVPALSRVPFDEIRDELPEGVRTFLRSRPDWIEDKFVEHLDEILKGYRPRADHQGVGMSARQLLMPEFTRDGTTLHDFIRFALTGMTPDGLTVKQSEMFGITDFSMDDNSGRLRTPLVLLELRTFGKGLTTQAEMEEYVREISALSQVAHARAERPWGVSPSAAAGLVIEDPLVKSLMGVFETTAELERQGVATFSPMAREFLAREAGAAARPGGALSPQVTNMLASWEKFFADQFPRWPGSTRVPAGLRPTYKAVHEALRGARKAAQQKLSQPAGRNRQLGAPLGNVSVHPPLVPPDESGTAPFDVPVVSAGAAQEVRDQYAWLTGVNPHRDQGGEFRTNCVLAAIATDMSLADPKRAVFQAPPSGPGEEGQGPADDGTGLTIYLGRYHGMEPYPVDGPAEVIEAMHRAPVGERGMVVVEDTGGGIDHVINVVRDGNGVVFLDGQAGALAPLPTGAVSFLPTTDRVPGFPLRPEAADSAATDDLPAGRPLRYRERVALAKRVWRRPVAEEVAELERTLLAAGPASRSLVMGVRPGQHLWVINVEGTIRWLDRTGQAAQAPTSAEGEVVSIDLDGSATLINAAPQLLRAGGGAARFCEIGLGADLKHIV